MSSLEVISEVLTMSAARIVSRNQPSLASIAGPSSPSASEIEAARNAPARFRDEMRSGVIDKMGVNGLRDDSWRSKIAPEAVAEMEKKLAEYGLGDARNRNTCINNLLGWYNSHQVPGDPAALEKMIDLTKKLGDLAVLVTEHRRDPAGQIMAEIAPKLGAGERRTASTILSLMIKQGIDDVRILRAVIAYAYAESGLKMSCISDGGQSIGWFQLGPEVGITVGHHNGEAQLKALLEKRVLDSRAAKWLGSYYQKGRKGFATFRDWLDDNRDAFGSKVAQVFGLCVNPSWATLKGTGRPYANAFKYLFGDK